MYTTFVGSATAEVICEHLEDVLDKSGIPRSRMLMLSRDGPNVNEKVLRLMNDKIKSIRSHGLMDFGSYQLHVMHNAFSQGLNILGMYQKLIFRYVVIAKLRNVLIAGSKVVSLAIKVHYYFEGHSSRIEEFEEVQETLHLGKHRFLRHVDGLL